MSAEEKQMDRTVHADLTPRLLTEDPGRLSQWSPPVFTAMSRAWSRVRSVIDERTLDLVVRRVDQLLTSTTERSPLPDRLSENEQHVIRLVDQFVLGVAEMTESHLEAPRVMLGDDGLRDLLEALYVIDQLTRLYIAHRRLFGGPSLDLPSPEPGGSDTLIELAAIWHDRVLELRRLDWLTTEAARLRGAWYHTCRLCASLRIVDDGAVVMDEALANRVRYDPPSTLPDRLSGAVMFADAHVRGPGQHLTADLCAELHEVFSADELLELTLDMTAWNHQKVTVSLRIEPPARDDVLSKLIIKDDGTVRIGSAIR